jgi:hypothetical protein
MSPPSQQANNIANPSPNTEPEPDLGQVLTIMADRLDKCRLGNLAQELQAMVWIVPMMGKCADLATRLGAFYPLTWSEAIRVESQEGVTP